MLQTQVVSQFVGRRTAEGNAQFIDLLGPGITRFDNEPKVSRINSGDIVF